MKVLARNGDLRVLLHVAVGDDWTNEDLPDRVRLTHPGGFRLEFCPTIMPGWPPSQVRKHFTAVYNEADYISVLAYTIEGTDGDPDRPHVFVFMYLPNGKQPLTEEEVTAISSSIRPLRLHVTTIVTDASDNQETDQSKDG